MGGARGSAVGKIPVTSRYSFDVKRLAEAAEKSGGGLIYICNPNNPTASMTPHGDVAWLVANLPANTYLLVDDAYLHFHATPETESALRYLRAGQNLIVTRT